MMQNSERETSPDKYRIDPFRIEIPGRQDDLEIVFDERLLDALNSYAQQEFIFHTLDNLVRGDLEDEEIRTIVAGVINDTEIEFQEGTMHAHVAEMAYRILHAGGENEMSRIQMLTDEMTRDLAQILNGAATPANDLMKWPPGVRNALREMGFKFVALHGDKNRVILIPDLKRQMEKFDGSETDSAIEEEVSDFLTKGIRALFKILVYQGHARSGHRKVVEYAQTARSSSRAAWWRILLVSFAEVMLHKTPYFAVGFAGYYSYKYVNSKNRMNRFVKEMNHFISEPPDVSKFIDVRVAQRMSEENGL